MVAETPTYGLPYWQSTDPPCFGGDCQQDNPFCDFMSIVDTQLTAVDDIVARTATTVPYARVDAPFDSVGFIFFETEVADTDDMVDLATFQGIIPNRDGVYQIQLDLAIDSGTLNDVGFAGIVIGSLTEGYVGTSYVQVASATWRVGGPADPTVYGHASTLWNFTSTSPTPRIITAQANFSTGTYGLTSASLSATWIRDAF